MGTREGETEVTAAEVAIVTRYYFHLMDGHEVIPDRTGVDVADLAAARDEALKAIQQFRQEHAATADEWQAWRIEVTNAWAP